MSAVTFPSKPPYGTVEITGGTITGITDLAVADGGTGSSTPAAARTALGAMQALVGSGTTTRATSDSTGTANVAHGLGVTPKYIRFAAADDAGATSYSEGVSVGTTQHSCHRHNASVDSLSATTSINVQLAGAGWTATVSAVDATNFTISFTKVGAGLNITILWAAFG